MSDERGPCCEVIVQGFNHPSVQVYFQRCLLMPGNLDQYGTDYYLIGNLLTFQSEIPRGAFIDLVYYADGPNFEQVKQIKRLQFSKNVPEDAVIDTHTGDWWPRDDGGLDLLSAMRSGKIEKFLKYISVEDGVGPNEETVRFNTCSGIEELVFKKGSIEGGVFPVTVLCERSYENLVRLPSETVSGAQKVWVSVCDLATRVSG